MARLPMLACGLPGALVGLWSLGLCAMTVAGVNPYWTQQPVNISEAAALRDAATVVNLIRHGADPRQPYPVRAGALFERAVTMTPLEAAVAARRAEVVDVILSARPLDAAGWTGAACLAASVPDEDIREVVAAHRPEGAPPDVDCASYARPW
ncbi:MAG TPA: hypothetical protein VFO31_23140 [Vicinamibacterales bacterium]|nr:hypothetical protein [Vicinamibacterales bacterium]